MTLQQLKEQMVKEIMEQEEQDIRSWWFDDEDEATLRIEQSLEWYENMELQELVETNEQILSAELLDEYSKLTSKEESS